MYVVIEYQRDGLGAASPDELLQVVASRAYAQGEMQVLGRDTGAMQVSWQIHPLASASALVLGSLRDGSFIVGPGLGYSVSPSVSFRLGAFAGSGQDASVDGGTLRFGSEYGATPGIVYTSMSIFF